MSDYRNNTNYPQNTQRPRPYANRSPGGRSVSSGAPINRAAPNRPPVNRSTANRTRQNRPIEGRSPQNTSARIRDIINNNTKPEDMSTEGISMEGSFGSASTQVKENLGGFKEVTSTEESIYQEASNNQRYKNNLSDLLNLTNMNSNDILKGIVLSEILGKPKALRRGRW
ncbi:MAG: hypothetical protein GX270_01850 [Clostridiaceae bacterium]|jgi:hypothetical protein|nr:hypothetical protein [Clostridiaceae bacterium]